MSTRHQNRCFFLEKLPTELRLMIYEELLVTPLPLSTPTLATEQDRPNSFIVSILSANRQIHHEAAAVFYGKNTFCIKGVEKRDGRASPEDVIAPCYRSLVRHLVVEVLPCPNDGGQETQMVANDGARGHIISLTSLLQQTSSLLTLTLTITPPPTLATKQVLTSLLPLTLHASLHTALASLELSSSVFLGFEFEDCFYRMRMPPDFLANDSLLLVACKVLFWRSHVKVEKMVRELQGTAEGVVGKQARTDLASLVGKDLEGMVGRVGEVEGLMDGVH